MFGYIYIYIYIYIYKGEHNYDIKTLRQPFLVIACCFVVFIYI